MTAWEVYESIRPRLIRRYGEDAAQDAGVKLLEVPPVSDHPKVVEVWLFQVAKCSLLQRFRKGRREITTMPQWHGNIMLDEVFPEPFHDPRGAIDARLQLSELPKEIITLVTKGTPLTSTERGRLARMRQRLPRD